MANFPKTSRKKLPPPPAPDEIRGNLSQPEIPGEFVDGRSLRSTGRTTQFTTRITDELQREIKVFTAQHGLKLNEFIEQAFEALKEKISR